MAQLVVNQLSRTVPVTDLLTAAIAADAGGSDAFVNSGKEFLVVFNNSGGNVTVTLVFTPSTYDGTPLTNHTLVVGAGKIGVVGPFPPTKYNDGSQNMTIQYSSPTNVKVWVGQLVPAV